MTVRPVEAEDRDEWMALYRQYRAFYALSPDDQVVERVWAWVCDEAHEEHSFVALDGGEIVGLATYRRFSRPSTGSTGIFLDDLFTDPAARGRGAGRALLAELAQRAESEGRSVVRWITNENNATARGLYDSVATATPWVTYDLMPGRRASP